MCMCNKQKLEDKHVKDVVIVAKRHDVEVGCIRESIHTSARVTTVQEHWTLSLVYKGKQ